MMLGTKPKKGPIFDILHKHPLFIAKDSKLQMITAKKIAECIRFLIKKNIANATFNIGGKGTVSFANIQKVVGFPVSFSKDSEKQQYEMNVSKIGAIYTLETSLAYLQDFLNSLKSQ